MTKTVSFRCDDDTIRQLAVEVARSGTTKSEVLVQAVRELLYRRACERDAETYARTPMTPEESAGWPEEAWIDDAPGTNWAEVFGQ